MPVAPGLYGRSATVGEIPTDSPSGGVQLRPLDAPLARPNTQTAQAMEGLGNATFDVAQQQQIDINKATVLDKTTQLGNWQNTLLHDPDNGLLNTQGVNAVGITPHALEEFDKRTSFLMDGVSAPQVQLALKAQIAESRETMQKQLLEHESTQSREYYKGTLTAGLALSQRTAAMNWTDPDAVEHQIQRQSAYINLMGDQAGASKEERDLSFQKAVGETRSGVVQEMISRGATAMADDYLNKYGNQMSPADYESKQRQLLTVQDRATRLSDKAQKQVYDQTAKIFDDRLRKDQLTAPMLEQERGNLDPADYRYFSRALTPGATEITRNPKLYSDLMLRAQQGEDVREDARAALQSAQIRLPDFDRLTEKVDRPGWYKTGSSYISDASGASLPEAKLINSISKADMLDSWDQWAKDHPKATDREARDAYRQIVSDHGLIKLSALPYPKFGVGSRLQLDLNATEQKTRDAFQSGAIDEPTAAREAVILKQWRAALGNVAAPKATP